MTEYLTSAKIKFTTEGTDSAVSAVDSIGEGLHQADTNAEQLGSTLAKTEASAEGLKRTGAALSQLGLGEVGALVTRIGDIQNVAKQLNVVVAQLPDLGAKIPLLGTAAETLTATFGVTITTFAAVAAPVLAVAAAIKIFSDTVTTLNKMVDDAVTGLKAQADAQLAVIDAVHNSTSEQIQAIIDVDKAKKKQLEDDLAFQQAYLADIQQQYADLGASFNPVQRAALGMAGQTAQKSIDDLTARIGSFTTEIDTNTNTILPAVQAREKETAKIEATKQAADDSAKAHDQLAKDAVKAVAELQKVGQALADENTKYAAILANRKQEDERAAQTGLLEQQINDAKAQEQAEASKQRIAAIHQSEADLTIETAQKRADGVAKINGQYMQTELKAFASYREAESRATQDYNIERVRKLEDLNSQLLDLAGSRDVAAFVNARKSGLTDIQQGDENFGVSAQRRKEDYDQQAQAAQAARDQQLSALNVSLQQETDTKRAALQKQLDQEIASQTQRATRSQELEKQLADLQAKFSRDDLAQRRKIEDDAHAQTVAKLTAQQQQLSGIIGAAIAPAVGFFTQVQNAIVAMIRNVQTAAASPAASASIPSFNASGNRLVTSGGSTPNFTRPTSASNVTVNVAGVGSLVSQADLHNQVNQIVRGVNIAIRGSA